MSILSDALHRALLPRPVSITLPACVIALALASGRASGQSNEIFVSNYTTDVINVYTRTANGDVGPTRTIRTGLDQPHTLGVDLLHRELYVANNIYDFVGPSVKVYDLTASYPNSDQAKRTITGPLTGLNRPAGIFVDSIHQELYVANDLDSGSSVRVFPLAANGNVAPIRILQGDATGIAGPIGLALDLVHDELVVVNYKVAGNGSITVFSRTASGNVAPLRTIQGDQTGFNRPQGLALDLAHDELIVANSFFGSASPGSIVVFPRTASGNVAPIREISGPDTALCNPIALTLDAVNGEIVVTNSHASNASCSVSVAAYARSASGDATPLRQIGPGTQSALANPEGVAVTTSVDCSDPSVAAGSPCDDGNACTPTDTCQGGVCIGSGSVVCVASDQCHLAGVCSPATGCSNPAKPDGSACDDGSLCTLSDSCQSGTCAPGTPVVCQPQDACHLPGTCDPGTGVCATGSPVVCTALDQCHVAGTCNNVTGCSNPAKPNGTACDDGNGCTAGDGCQAGVCLAGASTCEAQELYVADYSADEVAVFARTATGDVAPTRIIRAGLDHPHTVGLDLLHLQLYVSNNLSDTSQPAVNVYEAGSSYPGNDTPARTISGATTGLNRPAGLAVDSIHGELYVANDLDLGRSSVRVFPLGASGDVAPLRVLQGALTGIEGPVGLAVDPVHDELLVVSYRVADGGSLTVFPRTASGNVSPLRTLQGPLTGFTQPQGLALDLSHDEIIVANSAFSTASPGSLLVFPRIASGNVSPTRQLIGPDTALCNPIGLNLDLMNDQILVANSHFGSASCSASATSDARSASGDAPPVRQIGPGPLSAFSNPTSVAVKTTVDCTGPTVASGTPCDDGNACTLGDKCVADSCVGTPAVCNDNNPCTDDTCNPSTGCVFTNNAAPCSDENACTSGDVCSGGGCQPGAPVVCNDNNPCTEDSCDPIAGCVFTSNTNPCDDGIMCTVGDTCVNGTCVGVSVGTPSEFSTLRLSRPGDLSWTILSLVPEMYDIVSATLSTLAVSGTTASTCLSDDVAGTTYDDMRPDPPLSDGYYYLIRGKTACGTGSYGLDSTGQERLPAVPCP